MSFSGEVKHEILKQNIENDCCQFAFMAGVINTIGSIEIARGGFSFSIRTDNLAIVTKMQEIINILYADKVEELEIVTKTTGKVVMYEVVFPDAVGARILKDCGILNLSESNIWQVNRGIDHHIIMEDCCKKTYLKTVFLTSGTISIPIADDVSRASFGGYHFELELTNNEQAKAISHLLGEFGFISKKVDRGEKQVVYIKDSESIADFVGFVGATKSCLDLQNEIISRDVRNSINRQANCISANISKTVGACVVQLQAIEIIEKTIGIENLPGDLAEYATLRKENPDSSLNVLLEKLGGKITKSGLNYKLKKIIEIAKNL